MWDIVLGYGKASGGMVLGCGKASGGWFQDLGTLHVA